MYNKVAPRDEQEPLSFPFIIIKNMFNYTLHLRLKQCENHKH